MKKVAGSEATRKRIAELGLGLINYSQKATMEAKKTAAIKV